MKYSRILFFLVLATLASVYARTAQILYLTEQSSGFFTTSGKPIAAALSGVVVLATVAAAVMSCFTRRTPSGGPDKSILARVGAGIFGIACVWEIFAVSYASRAMLLVLLTRISAVVALFSVLLYILRGFVPALGKISKMAYIPMLIFFALKFVSVFTVYATVSVITDNVFYIAFMCCAILFVLYFLKLENGIAPGRSAYRLFPLGVATFILGACSTIPQAVLFLMGKRELVHSDMSSLVFPAAVAIFALCYVLALYSKKNIVRRRRNTPKLESDTSYHEMSGQFVSGGGKHRHKK